MFFCSIDSASDSIPAASVRAKRASPSPRICFLALPSKFAGASQRFAEMAHTLRIWPAVNPVQESLFVQEKVAGQYALKVQLLKEIAGGHGHLTERILRIAGFPACENFACFSELLLVEEIESSGELWYRREGRAQEQ
jgi:hypothetical protein